MKLQSRLDRLSIATLAPAFLLLSAFGCGPEATEAPKEEQAVTQAEAPGDFQISLAQWSTTGRPSAGP